MQQPRTQRCVQCAQLSIRSLVSLAEQEFNAQTFPQRAFSEHHRSFEELEYSASNGCDLCRLIVESLKATPRYPSDNDLAETLYDGAKIIEPSDIKICINTDHLYDGPLEKVQVFDNILVQVGRSTEWYEDIDEVDFPDRLTPAKLILKAARGDAFHLGGRRIGRLETDPDLGSPSNFDIAKSWFEECQKEHPMCHIKADSQLPTRVINVFTDTFDWVMVTEPRGDRAAYIALSHCWGGRVSPVLSSHTIEAFSEKIAVSTLSQNFQDAIFITRQLGVQYLWIDCLCILQDSQEDWANESQNMGRIYRDSVLTIYASASESSAEGIIPTNTESRPLPKRAILKLDRDQAGEVVVEVPSFNPENMRKLDIGSPLSLRGWTLQEWALAPRQLLYGKELIYWRCRQGYKSSDDLPTGNLFPDHSYDKIAAILHSDIAKDRHLTAEERADVFRDYRFLMMDYSHRNLTYDSDKLPALSGLCERLHHAIGGDFLAGLWSRDLVNQLLWRKENHSCKHVQPYRAPSWSWAVTNDMIIYDDAMSLYGHATSPGSLDIQLLDYEIGIRHPDNPYGEVTSGQIVVKGLTIPLVRSQQAVPSKGPDKSIGVLHFDDPESERETSFTGLYVPDGEHHHFMMSAIPDYQTVPEPNWKYEIDQTLLSSQEYWALIVQGTVAKEAVKMASGLLLQPVVNGADYVYERVGCFSLSNIRFQWLESDWEKRRVTLV